MPPALESAPPASFMQGDTLSWRLSSVDATPAESTLAVRVSGPGGTIDVAGVPEGVSWVITVAADQTQRLGAGVLKWLARATYAGGIVRTVDAGQITSVSVATLGDGSTTQSHAARMVALLEAQCEKLAADSLDAYTVGDRQATRRKLKETQDALRAARRDLSRERNGGRLPPVHLRFPPLVGIDTSSTGGVA